MKVIFRKIFSIVLVGCLLFTLCACDETPQSTTGIKSFSIEDLSEEDFYVGVNHGRYELSVICSKEYDENSIKVVVEDDSIIEVEYEYSDGFWFTGFKFDINCLKSGTTSFYFETIDSIVKSEPVEITVKENVKSITLGETDEITIYSWEDSETISFEYEYEHLVTEEENAFSFVSENPDVVTFEYDADSWFSDYCIITPINSGETYIYIQTKDGSVQSPKLKVIVPEEETEVEVTDNEDIYDNEDVYDEEEPQENSRTVYITPTGKKYHCSSSCAGKNAIARDYADVEGVYGPCKKCAY